MMMMKLAEATAEVDVYLVPANAGGGPGRAGTGRNGAPPAPAAAAENVANQSPTRRHFAMANSAGYPATSVPNGFRESGSPTAITFYARPFGETGLLALTKAYQDATGFHVKHPNLEGPAAIQTSAV